jgi:hypothetical protein
MKMRVVPVLAICAIAFCNAASAQEIDWKKVDEALGRPAAVSGDAHRYGFPRSDLQVTLDGVTIRPALALGGWVAAQGMATIPQVETSILIASSFLETRTPQLQELSRESGHRMEETWIRTWSCLRVLVPRCSIRSTASSLMVIGRFLLVTSAQEAPSV